MSDATALHTPPIAEPTPPSGDLATSTAVVTRAPTGTPVRTSAERAAEDAAEREAIRRWKVDGDETAIRPVVDRYLTRLGRRLKTRQGDLDPSDLAGAHAVTLVTALQEYDTESRTPFGAFLKKYLGAAYDAERAALEGPITHTRKRFSDRMRVLDAVRAMRAEQWTADGQAPGDSPVTRAPRVRVAVHSTRVSLPADFTESDVRLLFDATADRDARRACMARVLEAMTSTFRTAIPALDEPGTDPQLAGILAAERLTTLRQNAAPRTVHELTRYLDATVQYRLATIRREGLALVASPPPSMATNATSGEATSGSLAPFYAEVARRAGCSASEARVILQASGFGTSLDGDAREDASEMRRLGDQLAAPEASVVGRTHLARVWNALAGHAAAGVGPLLLMQSGLDIPWALKPHELRSLYPDRSALDVRMATVDTRETLRDPALQRWLDGDDPWRLERLQTLGDALRDDVDVPTSAVAEAAAPRRRTRPGALGADLFALSPHDMAPVVTPPSRSAPRVRPAVSADATTTASRSADAAPAGPSQLALL